MKKSQSLKEVKRNLRLVMAESALAAGLLAMPIMTPFFNSIGLNNEQIAFTQMIFTVVVMVLNVPLGYVADRISRKWANVIGDIGAGIILLFYGFTNDFIGVVLCECALGVLNALSSGVDQSLLRHFAAKLAGKTSVSEQYVLKKKTAILECYRQIVNVMLLLLAGPIGAISLRLAVSLSCVNMIIAGIISIFVNDDSEKLIPEHKNPVLDMFHVAKTALKNKPLRTRIFAFAVGNELTHGVTWIVTPLFLAAGVPLALVSFAWAFNALTTIIGAMLASRFSSKLSDDKIFALPLILMTISLLTMGINLNVVTVWFYALMGIVRGWEVSTLSPMVQKYTKPSEQTSVLSLAKVFAEILYIPVVWFIGFVADIRIENGLFASLAIFLPLGLIIVNRLRKSV